MNELEKEQILAEIKMLEELSYAFCEKLNAIPGIGIIPNVCNGDELCIELNESYPETTVYLSNPKLNEGEEYFGWVNLSLGQGGNLYANAETETKAAPFGTTNGDSNEVAEKINLEMKKLEAL